MPDRYPHIVFAEAFDAAAVEKMRPIGRITALGACDEGTLARAVRDCDALLVRSSTRVTRAVLAHAERLRVIGRAGAGTDNIDTAAAHERGVVVVYTPAAATDAVADLTVGLIIASVRRIRSADASLREGRFYEARADSLSCELHNLTLGIIGMGRIGRAVARRCRHGLGMPILYNDIVSPGRLDFTANPMAKEALYRQADVITLHVPLTDRTRHLIDARALAAFKRGAILINTSRGAVVESEALAQALCSGKLGGAALDVFEPEPLPRGHALLDAPNTVFTPHIGARTRGGLLRMNSVVDDVIRVLNGLPPCFPVRE